MWLFKRKVKRSEWMQGLLECEELHQKGARHVKVPGVSSYLYLGNETAYFCVNLKNHQRVSGYMAYIDHYEKYFKINL